MDFKKIIFQNRYVALKTPSRPPALHGKYHLKFPFWLFEHLPNLLWEPPTKDMFDLIAVSILFCCMKKPDTAEKYPSESYHCMCCQLICWVLKTNSEPEQREIANTKTVCITVAATRGLDVRQGSISDYRDTVTGPRADTTNLYYVFWCTCAVQRGKLQINT